MPRLGLCRFALVTDSSRQERPTRVVSVSSSEPRPTSLNRRVARRTVVARLQAHDGAVVIQTPAGYGKSSLIAEWLTEREKVAWVDLHRSRNHLRDLWSEILRAVSRSGHEVNEVTTAFIRRHDADAESCAARFLNDLKSKCGSLTLVLDGYEDIQDAESQVSIDYLIRHPIEGFQLVTAGRATRGLDTARHLIDGDLMLLSAGDLAFNPEETTEFMRKNGLSLSTEALDRLHEETEGWPAGAALAAVAIATSGATDPGTLDFDGASRLVVDYFDQEVWANLDAEQRSFFLATSILDELTAAACNPVSGRDDSVAFLDGLQRHGHFIVPLDDHRFRYRYHRLFRRYLESSAVFEGIRKDELHSRAAESYLVDGDVTTAIKHMLLADDTASAIDAVVSNYLPTVDAGRILEIVGWLELFP